MSETLHLRRDLLEWHKVDDEVVVLDASGSVYLSTNASGSLLWEKLNDGASSAELVQALRSTFGLDPSDAERDVGAFLADLERRGLLERNEL